MKQKIPIAYVKIIESLKKYSFKNEIPINRARYVISVIHRFSRPANTVIIKELCELGAIQLHGSRGNIEIVC